MGMKHNKIYDVQGHGFDSFMEAVAFAKSRRADVVEAASGIRRWTPATERMHPTKRHVLVSDDGTERPFSKVRQ